MEAADKAGCYPRLKVEGLWSAHNPVLTLGYLVKIVEKNYSDKYSRQPGRSSWSTFTQNWVI
jgi:hypothetical protein